MPSRAVLSAVFAVLVSLAATAHAQDARSGPQLPPSSPNPRAESDPTGGYAGSMLALDAISMALLVASDRMDAGPIGWLGGGGYLLGGPILHLAHDRPGRAGASLALRAGLPLAGLIVGMQFDDDRCDSLDCETAAIAGLGLGAVAAAALDVTLLAPRTEEDTPRPTVVPTIGPAPGGGASLGLAGEF